MLSLWGDLLTTTRLVFYIRHFDSRMLAFFAGSVSERLEV
jgi:hypothetical protein